MDSSFCNIPVPFQPLANPPSCVTALYSKNATSCSLQARKTQPISISPLVAHNIWILTSSSATVRTEITLICPEGSTKFITIQKPIHIL